VPGLSRGELERAFPRSAELLVEPRELPVETRESRFLFADLVLKGSSVSRAAEHAQAGKPPICLV
jgi:hypothetical protein